MKAKLSPIVSWEYHFQEMLCHHYIGQSLSVRSQENGDTVRRETVSYVNLIQNGYIYLSFSFGGLGMLLDVNLGH